MFDRLAALERSRGKAMTLGRGLVARGVAVKRCIRCFY
jgi:hypothetical protein